MAKKPKRKSIITRMDTLARNIIRARDVYCQCPECTDGTGLQCAHIIIRRYYVCRWDLLNLVLLCKTCHAKFDSNIAWGMGWFSKRFPARFEYVAGLEVLRRSPQERTKTWRDCDLKEIEDYLREKAQEMA